MPFQIYLVLTLLHKHVRIWWVYITANKLATSQKPILTLFDPSWT